MLSNKIGLDGNVSDASRQTHLPQHALNHCLVFVIAHDQHLLGGNCVGNWCCGDSVESDEYYLNSGAEVGLHDQQPSTQLVLHAGAATTGTPAEGEGTRDSVGADWAECNGSARVCNPKVSGIWGWWVQVGKGALTRCLHDLLPY